MNDNDEKLILDYLTAYSKNIGVPNNLLDLPYAHTNWSGKFKGLIDGKVFSMVLRPMAIEVEPNSHNPIGLFRVDEKMMSTEQGEVFFTSYSSPALDGKFELFRYSNPEMRKDGHEYVWRHTSQNGKYEVGVNITFEGNP